MLKIAICDDEKVFAEKLASVVSKYLKEKQIIFEIDIYLSGKEFINIGADITKYKIVFLDVNMEEVDGIETARKLRQLCKETFAQDFYDTWNSLLSATIIVINAHGAPTSIQFGKELVSSSDIVSNLNRKVVKFVWLISCNAGHYSKVEANIAKAISSKTYGGVVVASDGTVYPVSRVVYNSQIGAAASSEQDSEWKKYAGNRKKAKGWLLYKYNFSNKNTTVYSTTWGLSDISLYDISHYLVKNKFISYK